MCCISVCKCVVAIVLFWVIVAIVLTVWGCS